MYTQITCHVHARVEADNIVTMLKAEFSSCDQIKFKEHVLIIQPEIPEHSTIYR